jgi:hypothetical protein
MVLRFLEFILILYMRTGKDELSGHGHQSVAVLPKEEMSTFTFFKQDSGSSDYSKI